MRCVDTRITWGVLLALTIGLVACSALRTPGEPAAADKTAVPSLKAPAPQPSSRDVKLAAPDTPRSWADARLQAAKRMVLANPDGVYKGVPPDILLAIPVMSIELNGDGSIHHIAVLRYPSQARETVDMAMAAIKRAAPFGDVSRLPKPWKFNETFLFNADRKFKPMTLDQR